ncbi:class I SAM-dependent methyltransferase [uncultured Litoreibacter sp.]|uniref:class I SAM-dependent methyltransferase n=1 Tax=uncultured Litoreibacter sp. TaxID=1392394 RepID=UPI00261F0DEA|nr:class I SAM-dependent methyltransferase [uncultured Litoreibacter sp.]
MDLYRQKSQLFTAYEPLLHFHEDHFATQRQSEEHISRHVPTCEVLHAGRDAPAAAKVPTSAKFLDLYNFRESFVDPTGLTARQRQLLLATQARTTHRGQKVALFEYRTPLHNELRKGGLRVTGSHYVEDRSDPNFQDMQGLGYADGMFDFAVHSDVLEHVPDHKAALAESYRILKPGGWSIFTTPMFPMEKNMLRAEIGPDGTLIRHLPDEIHGDNLTGGILAFHNFGWELVENLREAGFSEVSVEVCLAPELGLYSSNCPLWTTFDPFQPGNMLPLVFVARR